MNLTNLQGIHVLLNYCPKLTHLSLTGVQAFLREDLLSFCRDAPPEFNDHQRDVFCVFSGHGVSKLREHLNLQEVYHSEATSSVMNGSEMGIDDPDEQIIDSESGANTPVMNMNVTGTHPPGMTPPAPGPQMSADAAALYHYGIQHNPYWTPHMANSTHALLQGGGPLLSQSAPASTGGALWVGGGSSSNAPNRPPPPPPIHGQGHGHGQHGHGNANQVTGMMGATVLDDVDEGDETFGDESELMND